MNQKLPTCRKLADGTTAHWTTAIVLTLVALVTGCTAPFWGSPNTTVDDAAQAVDTPTFRTGQGSSDKNSNSFFFNDKSKEIEKSLGL